MTRSMFSATYTLLREILSSARMDAKLTQAELGERLGRPQSFVSKYERGERRLDVAELLEIAHALGKRSGHPSRVDGRAVVL